MDVAGEFMRRSFALGGARVVVAVGHLGSSVRPIFPSSGRMAAGPQRVERHAAHADVVAGGWRPNVWSNTTLARTSAPPKSCVAVSASPNTIAASETVTSGSI